MLGIYKECNPQDNQNTEEQENIDSTKFNAKCYGGSKESNVSRVMKTFISKFRCF